MSRLVNPGVGEVCDRLTILSLKRLHGKSDGRSIEHFDREWATLHTQIRGRTLNGCWFEATLELAAVNAALWEATDALRLTLTCDIEIPQVTLTQASLGVRILKLNDERARLVAKINELAGEGTWDEKM